MIEEKVLALGKFSPDDLIVTLSAPARKIDDHIESQVSALWESKMEKAHQEGRVCFDGRTYGLNSLREEKGRIALDFYILQFRAREALPQIPEYFKMPEAYFHKGCYCGATVRTSDGKYLVVELSGKSMNNNTYDVLGGIMEEPLKMSTGGDVFNCLYAELDEEAHIGRADIKECYLRGIILTAKTYVSFYFEVILHARSEEILQRFADGKEDQDIKSLKAMGAEDYETFLRGHASKNKQSIARIRTI